MRDDAWRDRYVARVDLQEIARPPVDEEGWSHPEVVAGALARVVELPFERHDAYDVIASRPALAAALNDAVEHVERSQWKEAEALAALLEQGGDDEAARKLRICHNVDQGWWKIDPDNSKPPKYYHDRCWLRVCPHCAAAFANKLRSRYEERVAVVLSANVPQWSLKKLELTMRRSADLESDLVALHKMTKKLYKHFWGDDKRAGAFACAEIGPRGGNVHAHVVVYGRYVSQDSISRYWEKLSRRHRAIYTDTDEGRGDCVVWIKRIRPGQAVGEAIKYITKFAKRDKDEEGEAGFVLPVEDLAALHFALKGKRRVWSWGAFYGVDDVEEEDEGLQELVDDLATEAGKVVPVVVSHVALKAILAQLHSTVENNYAVFSNHKARDDLSSAAGGP